MRFRVKIALWMTGMVALLFGIGGSILLTASFGQTLSREEDELYHVWQMISGMLGDVGEINRSLTYEDVAESLSLVSGEDAQLWDMMRLRSGELVIYEVYGEEMTDPLRDFDSAGTGEEGGCEIRYLEEGARHVLILSGRLPTEETPVSMEMGRDISALFRDREAWLGIYRWVYLLLLVICGAVSYGTAGILTGPLSHLTQASRRIAGGDLSGRADVDSGDEIGILGKEFNQMAEYLEATVDQLKQEMENQEHFMGNFSHELKTPMTSIIGYADLIRGGTLSEREQAEAADYIVSEGKRLENLSMKLLKLLEVKKEEAAFGRTAPSVLLERAAEYLRPVCLEKGITLTVQTEAGECRMDADLVSSLVLNLLDNAVKSMTGEGGEIRLRQQMTPDGCRIFVADNGRGIPPEALPHLTEPFYRADKSRSRRAGGAGLGLSLCREIAEIHGGYLRFRSREGTGTAVMAVLKGGR